MSRRHFRPIAVENIPPNVARSVLVEIEAFPNFDGLINGVEWFGSCDWAQQYLRTRDWRWFVADPIAAKPTVHDHLKDLKERCR